MVELTQDQLSLLKTKPWDHQAEVLPILQQNDAYALLMEMGTGKSKTYIDDVILSYYSKKIDCAILIAPKNICKQWVEEQIAKHMPEAIDCMALKWDKQSKKFENKCKILLKHRGLIFLVIHPEALLTERGAAFVRELLDSRKVSMGIDESTVVKNGKASRTKLINSLGQYAVQRRIMTGTPIANCPLDVYSQFEFLQPGYFGSSFVSFRARYAEVNVRKTGRQYWDSAKRQMVDVTFDEIVNYRNLDELQQRIAALSFRKLKSECLKDLPPKIFYRRESELSSEQEKYYQEMVKDSVAFLESGEVVTATIVLTKYLRMRQALANIYPSGEEDEMRQIAKRDNKAHDLMDAMNESSGKTIIWASFIPCIDNLTDLIAENYGSKRVVKIHGQMKPKDKDESLQRFKFEDADFLVMNPRSGGRGLDLVMANNEFYYDNDWSLEVRLQSEDRIHRGEQRKSCNYTDMVYPDTIDISMLDNLQERTEIANVVTGDNLRRLIQQAHGQKL